MRKTGSFFSNFNFSLSKESSALQAILEVGEIYFGDTDSGGAQGARGKVVEVRNIFIEHEINEKIQAKAGILDAVSDPRSFIFNDHIAGAQLTYDNTFAKSQIWYGVASKLRPAATESSGYLDDHYLGLEANLNFLSGIKNTLFGLFRKQANVTVAQALTSGSYSTAVGETKSYWLGGTFEYAGFDPFVAEVSLIHNWNSTLASGFAKDSYTSHLLDAKIGYSLPKTQINFSLEGLATSGQSNSDDGSGNKVLGRRKAFNSPVAASYLLTVATNDGVDDAAGTPKQSVIANLGQDEGLRVLVGTVSGNVSKRWTLLARYGYLGSAAASSTGSKSMGYEMDVGGVYQLNSVATVGFDYGVFKPGAFYAKRDSAKLGSVKYKLSF